MGSSRRREDLLDPTELLNEAIANGLGAGYADIDDREIPQADNAVQWLISPEFLNFRPYPKQLEDAIHIFSAACYFCSDSEYLVDIPVEEKLGNILDRCTLMKRGVCPKCRRTALEMRQEWCLDPANTFGGRIKPDPPNDIVCLEGQRCVVGTTKVLVKDKGSINIADVVPQDYILAPGGWKEVTSYHQFAQRDSLKIELLAGQTLHGGYNHRVLVLQPSGNLEFVRFNCLKRGDLVACHGGQVLSTCGITPTTSTALQVLSYYKCGFSSIKQITKEAKTDLFDLTVDGGVYWSDNIISHNSGKSFKTSMYCTYVLHRFLKIPNPSKYFGLAENIGLLSGTFVSVTARQAQKNVWQPFTDFINSAPWFQKYHAWLKEKGEEKGTELFSFPSTFLIYFHKRLEVSFRPADQRTLRGATRFFACEDELGWFSAAKDRAGVSRVMADGAGTVRALDRSLLNVRNAANRLRRKRRDCPDGYHFTISSPSSATDPMMQRFKRAEDAARMYYIKRPTWQSNPTITEEGLRLQESGISERDFQCDYACNPPYSDAPWWENEDALLGVCNPREERLWVGQAEIEQDVQNPTIQWLYYKLLDVQADQHTPRCLAFDTADRANSFSWAVGCYDKPNDLIVIEDIGELAPGPGNRIHHGYMWEHLIKPLVEKFSFLHVVWDRWESTRFVADLRTQYQVGAEQYTATAKDGKKLRSALLGRRIVLPRPECPIGKLPVGDNVGLARFPRAHLLLQCLSARDANGLPMKPQQGNDDTLRAVLLAHTFIDEHKKEYGIYSRVGGNACVGVGVGGRLIGGRRRIRQGATGAREGGVIVGSGGRVIGVGPRRR